MISWRFGTLVQLTRMRCSCKIFLRTLSVDFHLSNQLRHGRNKKKTICREIQGGTVLELGMRSRLLELQFFARWHYQNWQATNESMTELQQSSQIRLAKPVNRQRISFTVIQQLVPWTHTVLGCIFMPSSA